MTQNLLSAAVVIGALRINSLLLFVSFESICNIIPYFCRKLGKMTQNLLSAAVVIGALRINSLLLFVSFESICPINNLSVM